MRQRLLIIPAWCAVVLWALGGLLAAASPATALDGPFARLPIELNDKNTTVRFEVDSTWHLVEGKVSQIEGRVWLADPAAPESLHAHIIFPVASFDTDSSRRDSRMREVLASEQFQNVSFDVSSLVMTEGRGAALGDATLAGTLAIRGVSRAVAVPVKIEDLGNAFVVSGKTSLEWPDYQVEDPSIFIAKLDPKVQINFSVQLPK